MNQETPAKLKPVGTKNANTRHGIASYRANGISDQQEAFCQALIMRGLNIKEAALAAGYAPSTAEAQIYRTLQLPTVGARIEQLTRKLLGSHAPLAVSTLVNVMQDPEANAMARVRATEVLLDRAGFKPIERYEDISRPGSLDVDALKTRAQELIEELRRREAQANVIDVTPIAQEPCESASAEERSDTSSA
jgi:hypothetical protein